MNIRWMNASCSFSLIALSFLTSNASAGEKEKPFVARPFTEEKSFTAGIEGPACDAHGNVYVVNFAKQQTIGIFTPEGKASIFVTPAMT